MTILVYLNSEAQVCFPKIQNTLCKINELEIRIALKILTYCGSLTLPSQCCIYIVSMKGFNVINLILCALNKSSRPELCFYESLLISFAEFIGKHFGWSLLFNKFVGCRCATLLKRHSSVFQSICFRGSSKCYCNFCEKNLRKELPFYDIFSQFLSSCTRSQNFNVRIFIERKHRRIENGNKFLLTWAIFNNFCEKTYEKTYRF